jgi:alpha-glucosidase
MSDWWRGAVMYQIYPRSFADADGNGIGGLKGITSKLDYVASLGVDGIWLSPISPSPMKDFGYDVSDYRDIEPEFGTLADFDALLERAHALGLRVVIDQVYSHSSDEHPWFQESRRSRDNPKADWYVWADPKADGSPPNNWLSVFGGVAWEWEPRRRQYYLHNFVKGQPYLNFHNPEVQAEILDIARFWLSRGVDGFRLDTANFYTHDALLRDNPPLARNSVPENPYDMQDHVYDKDRPENLPFVTRLRSVLDEFDDRMIVAELGTENFMPMMAAYTDGPERYHTAYSFVFLQPPFGARYIRENVEELLREAPGAWPSWAFSNHDVIRVMSRWAPEDKTPAKAKALLALVTSLRGTAFLYQGEELGLTEADVPFERIVDPKGLAFWPEDKGRDGCRTPMPWDGSLSHAGFSPEGVEPWLPVGKDHPALSVASQSADPTSTLAYSRRFLAWRRQQPALKTGSIRFLDAGEPVLAFLREEAGQRILVVFNLSGSPRSFVLPGDLTPEVAAEVSLDTTLQGNAIALGPWGVFLGSL